MHASIILLLVSLALSLSGCGTTATDKQAPFRNSGILPSKVEFSTAPATGQLKRVILRFSITNANAFAIPAKAFELEVFVDRMLVGFDRAVQQMLPNENIDYSFDVPLLPGKHSYKLGIVPRSRTVSTRGEFNGTFEFQ